VKKIEQIVDLWTFTIAGQHPSRISYSLYYSCCCCWYYISPWIWNFADVHCLWYVEYRFRLL